MSRFRPRALGALPIAVLALSLQALTPSAAQTAPITLVSTEWPPFTDAPGKPRFALDLVEAALGRVGHSSRTTIVPAPDFTTSLLSARFSGSAAAWKDAEREKVLIFSEPYLENRLLLVGQKGSDVSATSLAALKGKRIAITQGYSYGESIDASGPTFLRMPTEAASLSELLLGSVDYVLMDELVVRYVTRHYSKESQERLQIGAHPLVTRPLYLAIRRDLPNAQAIIDGFNTQLRAMIADHTYHKLLHLDWISADVDGDGVAELVAAGDHIGALAPTSAYALATEGSADAQPGRSGGAQNFHVAGTTYSDWDSVPSRFKVEIPASPDPADGTMFMFRW